jgi:UPF0176 protein
MLPITVSALYKFVSLPDYETLQPEILRICKAENVFGTILLAREGINGTIAGPPANITRVLAWLKKDSRLADLEHKESHCHENPFYRMKVRLKREIVTMGIPEVNPTHEAGIHIEPEDWNSLISDPQTLVIDTRNDYEVAIGTFEDALNPQTTSFRNFPQWFRENRALFQNKPKIAMFCTGGIRCEKATAFLKREGFEDVFHLKGGILKYLETVPEKESLWQGECFVFDNRVSVGHGLKPGPYDLCHACRHPISDDDKASSYYEKGVSCPHCHNKVSAERKARFAARQMQIELAKARGEQHIAADFEQAKARKQHRKRAAQLGTGRNTSD